MSRKCHRNNLGSLIISALIFHVITVIGITLYKNNNKTSESESEQFSHEDIKRTAFIGPDLIATLSQKLHEESTRFTFLDSLNSDAEYPVISEEDLALKKANIEDFF